MDRGLKIFRLLQLICRLLEGFSHNGVQHHIGRGHGIRGPYHTELKLVARKGKGGRPVSVRGVFVQVRQGSDAGHQLSAGLGVSRLPGAAKLIDHILQLLPHKDRDNGRRRLVRAQPVVVAHIGGRFPQKIRMGLYRFHDAPQHQKELDILMGSLPGI